MVVFIVALIGFLALDRDPDVIQGQMEVEEYRLSSKVPGRILELRVKEGDLVHKGDILAIIDAPEVQAKKVQAESARNAASALHEMADNGAREETIRGAYELLQQAKAANDIARKTYERVNNLFKEGVVTAQRRDEALAAMEATGAQVKAAQSQYDMARNGARMEERKASSAQVNQASGADRGAHHVDPGCFLFWTRLHCLPLSVLLGKTHVIVLSLEQRYYRILSVFVFLTEKD